MMIRGILILFLFFGSSALAVNKAQLIADIQYLLSAEPTIDYDDPKLNKILNKYNYRLFKTYKAFIEFDRSKKTKADLLKAKAALRVLSQDPKWLWNRFWKSNELNAENVAYRFFDLVSHYRIADDMLGVLPEEKKSWDESYQYQYFKIPLWFTLKYPDNLRITNGPGKLIVNAKKSVRNIDEFNKFLSILGDISGGFITPDFGLQKFDSYLMTKHFIDVISFSPGVYFKYKSPEDPCLNKSIQERFAELVKWAYRTEENMLKYKEFMLYFDKTSEAIEDYYKNNYNLGQYASRARDILSYYICDNTTNLDYR